MQTRVDLSLPYYPASNPGIRQARSGQVAKAASGVASPRAPERHSIADHTPRLLCITEGQIKSCGRLPDSVTERHHTTLVGKHNLSHFRFLPVCQLLPSCRIWPHSSKSTRLTCQVPCTQLVTVHPTIEESTVYSSFESPHSIRSSGRAQWPLPARQSSTLGSQDS